MNIEENDLKLLLKALSFSSLKHKDQRRKDTDASPYINHPISLANILCNEGHITDIEVICAALLHDTIEDTETSPDEIAHEFGVAIRDIVMEVTDNKSLDKKIRKQAQIEHAAHISDKAKVVKLADKISNLRDVSSCPPHEWSLEDRQEYFDWAKKVIDRLQGVNPMLECIFDEVYSEKLV